MPTIAGNMRKFLAGDLKSMINIVRKPASWGDLGDEHGFVGTPEHADLHRRTRAPLARRARRHGSATRSTCC